MESIAPAEFEVLRKRHSEIVRHVDVNDVIDQLFADGLLSRSELERIQHAGVTKEDKTRA